MATDCLSYVCVPGTCCPAAGNGPEIFWCPLKQNLTSVAEARYLTVNPYKYIFKQQVKDKANEETNQLNGSSGNEQQKQNFIDCRYWNY